MRSEGPSPSGPFHRWLLETQIGPVFRAHAFVQRAEVLVRPRLWLLERGSAITELVIFYAASGAVDLDAAVEALARDAQDPNLPAGVSLDDLHLPIVASEPLGRPPPLAITPRDAFRGARRDPEHGHFEALDAFASYASFARGADGAAQRLRVDDRLSAMLDGVMPDP
ncbi:MAG: hypothetical protein JST00_14195 [Deltaproteobacteria bacterium]|nr:hypothetical protein [Deltaproteobacteria bacterium]